MSAQTDLLAQVVTQLKSNLVVSLKNAGRSATGKTEQAITVDVLSDSHIQLTAPAYFYALETGRKPTGPNPQPGNPLMIDNIKEWCMAKGISGAAAWAIKKSIDKNGYAGKPGVISEPLSDNNIDNALTPVLGAIADMYSTEILKGLNLPVFA